jgi:2-C-methyl-D-erythritol 4-phosphate cytidylyltransferase
MNTLAIVIACGKEEEITRGTETAFLTMGNLPVLAHSLKTLQNSNMVDGFIIACAKDRVDSCMQVAQRFGYTKLRGIVIGGVNRLSTLRAVISKLPEKVPVVIVHEASRPFVTDEVITEAVKATKRYGCAIAAHKLQDATKVAPSGLKATKTLERNTVWMVQSPQVFKIEVLEKIIDPKNKKVKLIDDESEFVGKPAEVHLIEAGSKNMKIRTADDLAMATALFNATLR